MDRAIAIGKNFFLLENGKFLKVRDNLEIGKVYSFNLYKGGVRNLKILHDGRGINIDFDTSSRIYKGFKNSHLIDVRKKSEFHMDGISQAVNMPLKRIEHLSDINIDHDDIVMVYCRSGNRSGEAQGILEAQGFKLVFNVGGILDYNGEFENIGVH